MQRCVAVLTLGLVCALPLAAAEKAQVLKVENDVKVCRLAGGCETARFGQAILEGDTVVTGEKGTIRLRFKPSGTWFIAYPNTIAVVSSVESDNEGVEIRRGKIHTKVLHKGKESGFKITTPTAAACPEGTEFVVEVDSATGETEITLIEGRLRIVSLFAPQDSIVMRANHHVRIGQDKRAPNPEPLRDGATEDHGTANPTDDGSGLAEEDGATDQDADIPALDIGNAQGSSGQTVVEMELGIDRLYESGQSASDGFVNGDGTTSTDDSYTEPQPTKDKSKVIIEVH